MTERQIILHLQDGACIYMEDGFYKLFNSKGKAIYILTNELLIFDMVKKGWLTDDYHVTQLGLCQLVGGKARRSIFDRILGGNK